MKFLVFDTETGGLDPQQHSLLSLGAVVWEDGAIIDTLELLVNEPEIVITPKALAVNRIDLLNHTELGLPPVEVMRRFQLFLDKNFGDPATREKVQLVGHNILFDIGFLRRLCQMASVPYDATFSHRCFDTAAILRFLTFTKKLTIAGASAADAFEFFGITVAEKDRHTALADAYATALLFSKLVELAA